MVRVKICCISSVEEAQLAIAAGASALGLVSEMPSGPGVLDLGSIAEIAKTIPPLVATFLLTSSTSVPEIVEQQRASGTNTLQLVEALSPANTSELRRQLPGIKIVKVIHVESSKSVELALSYRDSIDALLLDSGNTSAEVKELGGTGRTHDWSVSREIVARSELPVFLAGGLNSGNVSEAIQKVAPFAVDVCSGVRSEGKLDPQKLSMFMQAVASTD